MGVPEALGKIESPFYTSQSTDKLLLNVLGACCNIIVAISEKTLLGSSQR